MGETKPLGSLHFLVQNPASSSSVRESGVPRSLFPLLQSHWTLLSLKNTSTVSEPIQTAVHYEAVLKYSHKAQLPIMKCRLLTTLLNSTTTRTVFYPLSTARLLPTGCKRKNGSSVLLTAVPKGKHRTSSSKKSTI